MGGTSVKNIFLSSSAKNTSSVKGIRNSQTLNWIGAVEKILFTQG